MAPNSARALLPALLAGAAFVLAAAAFVRGSGTRPPPREPAPPAADEFEAAAQRRLVLELEDRLRKLELALARVSTPPAPAAPGPGSAPDAAPSLLVEVPEALSRRVDQIDQDVSRIALDRALSTEEGQTRLRSMIREERQRLDAEDRRRWQDRSREFAKDFVAQFAKEANLTRQQAEAVERVTLAGQEARAALVEKLRADEAAPGEFRTRMRALREQTETELRPHLNEQQLELYRQRRDEMRRGGGFGGG
jgi:hypothetical protein